MISATERPTTGDPKDGTSDEVSELIERTRSRRHRWRWVAVAVVLAILAGGVVVAARGLDRDPRTVRSALIGKPAPAFTLPTLDGDEIDSSSFRGEVVVVNFWASWCVPCRQEAPELQAFARRWDGGGVRVIGIVYNDAQPQAETFRARYGLTYPQVMDPGGRTAIDFGVFGVPETFVIGPDGVVMARLLGAVNGETLERAVESARNGDTVSQQNDQYRTAPPS